MVLVLKDWVQFKDYLKKWGNLTEVVYRISPVPGEKAVRVRILGGRYGLDVMIREDNITYKEIQSSLDSCDAKRIDDVRDVEAFFS
jgi:hypothetical protein